MRLSVRLTVLTVGSVAVLGCAGLGDTGERVRGEVAVNGRSIPARDWCPSRLGTGGETWTFALSDDRFEVGEVGLRAGPGPLHLGVYSAEKGGVPKGEVNDFGVVEIGTEPCVELVRTGPGAGVARFDCAGPPVGVVVDGDDLTTRIEVRGELAFEGCPFP